MDRRTDGWTDGWMGECMDGYLLGSPPHRFLGTEMVLNLGDFSSKRELMPWLLQDFQTGGQSNPAGNALPLLMPSFLITK